MPSRIKLLVVDDSALMRRQLTSLFDGQAEFEVVAARNGREALELNREFQPDVVTLDINMPEMDGLTALSMIMVDRPVPVIMVSSLTEKGALATFEALNLGAIDYVCKPGGTISLSIDSIRDQLVAKVRTACHARLKPGTAQPRSGREQGEAPARRAHTSVPPREAGRSAASAGPAPDGVVVIGVSTGGPRTLEAILPQLPADFPWAVLVAQHMPASFTQPFAQRLNGACKLPVLEVSRPTPLSRSTIYVAKGGADMQLVRRSGGLHLVAVPENDEFLWHPSVELLGRSVLEHYPAGAVLGVMLTGMGNDGCEAFSRIRQQGGRTIAESEDSAVVFGMPAELIARGGASLTLHADRIGRQITSWVME